MPGQQHDGMVQYIDDSQIYEDDHGTDNSHLGNNSHVDGYNSDGYSRTGAAGHDYYYGHGNPQYHENQVNRDMW